MSLRYPVHDDINRVSKENFFLMKGGGGCLYSKKKEIDFLIIGMGGHNHPHLLSKNQYLFVAF